jgi:parallel beta-helix repeat protein
VFILHLSIKKMVYKKYVYKRGKKHGPYYYHSYREGSSVRKVYIGGERAYKTWLKKRKKETRKGVEQRRKERGKILFVLALIGLIFALLINFNNFFNVQESFAGYAVMDGGLDTESDLYGNFEEEIVVERFDTERIDLEIKEPARFAGESITKNKNKVMDFHLPEGRLLLYFDLLNYTAFIEAIEFGIEEQDGRLYTRKGGGGGYELGELREVEREAEEDKEKYKEKDEDGEIEIEEEEEEAGAGITGEAVKEAREKVKKSDKETLGGAADSSVIETEDFDINVKKPNYRNPKYKWGYKVKLKDLNFMAKIDVTSEEELEILDNKIIKIGDQLLSFNDLVGQGYDVRIEVPALEMEISTEKAELPAKKPKETKEKKEKKTSSEITGKAINLFTRSGKAVGDLKYENIVIVYIERDFTNTDHKVGDFIYLDPTLETITIQDVTLDAYLINITAEVNFTHLNVSNTAPYDSLVLYMPFDGDLENTATTTHYDFTKENNDGTANGNAVVNETGCIYGNCLQLDGNEDYVDLSISLGNYIKGNFTASLWWKRAGVSGGSSGSQYHSLIDDISGFGGYPRILVDDNGLSYLIQLSNGTGSTVSLTDSTDSVLDTWYHLVLTYFNETGNISFYIDGVISSSIDAGSGLTTSTSKSRIGAWVSDSTYYNTNGSIDEVMIFNTSLTAAQILDIYNNNSARFLSTGTESFGNQSEMNISTGAEEVRVTGDYQAIKGSSINLSVGYYAGSWAYTTPQVYDGDNTFAISPQSTNLTLNFTFFAGNQTTPFYSPLLSSAVNYLVVNLTYDLPGITIGSPANTTYYASTIDFNVSSSENLSSCKFTLTNWAINYSMMINASKTGANYTNTSISDRGYTARFWCNDTANYVNNTEQVTFSINVTEVTTCRTLNETGTVYTQQADIVAGANPCINISAQNITFNGNGYSISNTVSAPRAGISTNSYNTTIKNCNSSVGSFGQGVVLASGSDNSYVYNCTLNNQLRGLYVTSDGNKIEKVTANSNSIDGIFLDSSTGNNLTEIIASSNDFGIRMSSSSNNNITDSNFSGSSTNDVDLASSSTGNIFLNVSYSLAKENVASGSLTRKWHYGVYVNDSDGTGVFANISIYNESSTLIENFVTNSSGGFVGSLTDYTNDGTRTYIGTRTIWARNTTIGFGYNVYNISSENNRPNDVITIDNLIDSCISLPFANTVYNQSADITNNSLIDHCITMGAANITFDCKGYSIQSDDNFTGIYSDQDDTTIRNCNVSMSTSSGGYGIRLVYANKSYIYNNTLNYQDYGFFGSGDYVIAENNTANSNEVGMYIGSGKGNNLTNNNIWNCTTTTHGCLHVNLADNSTISQGVINLSSSNLIMISGSSNNLFENIIMEGSNISDVNISDSVNSTAGCLEEAAGLVCTDITAQTACANQTSGSTVHCSWTTSCANQNASSSPECSYFGTQSFCEGSNQDDTCWWQYLTYTDSTNNIFLNMSYNSSREFVFTNSSLIRKWYYQGNVSAYYNDSVMISLGNLTVYNVSGDYQFNLTTNANGLTSLGIITDYINRGGTRTYYSPHIVRALNSSYMDTGHTWNVTAQQNTLDTFYILKSQSNLTLNKGWNLITLLFDQNDSGTDRNISIASGWNLIGHSSETDVSVDDLIFTDSASTQYTWASAITNSKLQAYLTYYDSSGSNASQRRNKFAAPADLNMDSSVLTRDQGYWLYSNGTGNLTLPDVGGAVSGENYLWSKLRFKNASGSELNISDAGIGGEIWINEDNIRYWGKNPLTENYELLYIGEPESIIRKTVFSPFEGVFVYSYKDNITLLRQN